jgi:hypothetical protein
VWKRSHVSALLILLIARPSPGDISSDAVRELAGKIVTITGSLEEVSLTMRSLSSHTPAEVADARRGLETELQSRGIRFTNKSDGTARIDVTLSENLDKRLWIADIRRGESRDVVMVVRALASVSVPRDAGAPLALQKKLLVDQVDPILDLALIENEMLVLEPARVACYRRKDERWEMRQSLSLPERPASSRDARGRLILEKESFSVYLPGIFCAGSSGGTLSMECKPREARWPFEFGSVELAKGRNFFSPKNLPAFFSAAATEEQGNVFWILAGVDGRTLLFDKSFTAIGSFGGWGSEIAGVESSCGRGRQVLATLRGDSLESEVIQAFEFVNRHAAAVSPPLELPGLVTAFWPSASRDSAYAVARNIKTGRYAAFQVSVVCGR